MAGSEPFTLLPLDDDRYELRAFSDTSTDPICLTVDRPAAAELAEALAEVLTALDAPNITVPTIELNIDGRRVVVSGTAARGLRLTVDR